MISFMSTRRGPEFSLSLLLAVTLVGCHGCPPKNFDLSEDIPSSVVDEARMSLDDPDDEEALCKAVCEVIAGGIQTLGRCELSAVDGDPSRPIIHCSGTRDGGCG